MPEWMSIYYALQTPNPLPWYWFVPLAILWLIGWCVICYGDGLKCGTAYILKVAYRIFIRGRISLKSLDILMTGLILVMLARPLMHWPTAGMAAWSVGHWVITIGFFVAVADFVRTLLKRMTRGKQ